MTPFTTGTPGSWQRPGPRGQIRCRCPQLRPDPAGALPLLPGICACGRRFSQRSGSGICPSRPLCLRRGRSLCPGRGSAAVRRRVRRAGFWGRDPGPCPADPDRTAAADPGLPHRPARRLSKRRPQLCCGTAGSRTVLCPDSGAAALLDKPNNNLAVEYCKAILSQGAALTPRAPGTAGSRPWAGSGQRGRTLCQRQRLCAAFGLRPDRKR